ncbi:DUF3347 domain-containing protein [Aequorivita echinoideorum]|uniref:DUF3347 domain-containing protein n=1 Tax=Aequorivita echinoideorum TaxID=1549647 RepID=A0ABS5S2V9_9FLAO|nr:DUF3347 domain-containing protein [Aequorivita echinoideorum]MBT0607308.1 DUF3347 domain-containing protein [Aequorivita echinoideorum]
MKKITLLFFACTLAFFNSCKENPKDSDPEVVTIENDGAEKHEIAKSNAKFKDEQVAQIFDQYLQVEGALVNTDETMAAKESSKLLEIITEVDDDPTTVRALETMANTDDVEIQRLNFVKLTVAMEDILADALESGAVYKQYCPMAFNNTGAYWLSSSKDILNPYFGDKMLKCGRVEAELN